MEDTYKHLDNFVKEITCPVLWRIFFFIDLFLWKNSSSDEYKTFSASICNFNWRVGWQMSTAVKWWNPEGMLNSRQNEPTKIFCNFFTQRLFFWTVALLCLRVGLRFSELTTGLSAFFPWKRQPAFSGQRNSWNGDKNFTIF